MSTASTDGRGRFGDVDLITPSLASHPFAFHGLHKTRKEKSPVSTASFHCIRTALKGGYLSRLWKAFYGVFCYVIPCLHVQDSKSSHLKLPSLAETTDNSHSFDQYPKSRLICSSLTRFTCDERGSCMAGGKDSKAAGTVKFSVQVDILPKWEVEVLLIGPASFSAPG